MTTRPCLPDYAHRNLASFAPDRPCVECNISTSMECRVCRQPLCARFDCMAVVLHECGPARPTPTPTEKEESPCQP